MAANIEPKVIIENIPPEMCERSQWVGWDDKTRAGKRTKIPFDPKNGKPASSTDPKTWGTFAEAVAYAERTHAAGVGYVFTANDPFFGIDLDACRNPETGELTEWATEIIQAFDSYTEISPSGYGVKIVARGTMPKDAKHVKKLKNVPTFGDKEPEIAIYDRGRYWCMTGRVLSHDDV